MRRYQLLFKQAMTGTLIFTFIALMMGSPVSKATSRIKDLVDIAGVRENQIVGYGLVVGLDGTGDKISQSPFTQQSFRNMLVQFGIRLPQSLNFDLKNVAAVAVSAKLPPFAKLGQNIDVNVSSLGNATSLRGGELLMTELRGADNQVYAVAQGSVVVSGFGAQGSDGSKVTVNVTSSGRIPNGATVEQTIEPPFVKNGILTLQLQIPDFTTAEKIANAINKSFFRKIAKPIDASAISVNLQSFVMPVYPNASYKDDGQQDRTAAKPVNTGEYVHYIAKIENIMVNQTGGRARIIVNSRTGTIVIDENVAISPVAVAHGNLSVVVSERPYVSQPNALAAGTTVTGSASDININQTENRAFLLQTGTTLKDLVDEINRVGAAPGDIIAILEAVKASGALHADLEVI